MNKAHLLILIAVLAVVPRGEAQSTACSTSYTELLAAYADDTACDALLRGLLFQDSEEPCTDAMKTAIDDCISKHKNEWNALEEDCTDITELQVSALPAETPTSAPATAPSSDNPFLGGSSPAAAPASSPSVETSTPTEDSLESSPSASPARRLLTVLDTDDVSNEREVTPRKMMPGLLANTRPRALLQTGRTCAALLAEEGVAGFESSDARALPVSLSLVGTVLLGMMLI